MFYVIFKMHGLGKRLSHSPLNSPPPPTIHHHDSPNVTHTKNSKKNGNFGPLLAWVPAALRLFQNAVRKKIEKIEGKKPKNSIIADHQWLLLSPAANKINGYSVAI